MRSTYLIIGSALEDQRSNIKENEDNTETGHEKEPTEESTIPVLYEHYDLSAYEAVYDNSEEVKMEKYIDRLKLLREKIAVAAKYFKILVSFYLSNRTTIQGQSLSLVLNRDIDSYIAQFKKSTQLSREELKSLADQFDNYMVETLKIMSKEMGVYHAKSPQKNNRMQAAALVVADNLSLKIRKITARKEFDNIGETPDWDNEEEEIKSEGTISRDLSFPPELEKVAFFLTQLDADPDKRQEDIVKKNHMTKMAFQLISRLPEEMNAKALANSKQAAPQQEQKPVSHPPHDEQYEQENRKRLNI